MRNDGTVWHWDYDPDTNRSDGDQVVGTLGERPQELETNFRTISFKFKLIKRL